MKRNIVFLLWCPALVCCYASPELNQYKDMTEAKFTEPVLLETFDRSLKDWKLGAGFKTAPGDGVYGTTALLYHRTDAGHPATARKKFPVRQGIYYAVSLNYRTDLSEKHFKIHGDRNKMEIFCIRFFTVQGKYISGAFMAKNQVNQSEWGTMKLTFLPPPNAGYGEVELLMRTGRIGKIWFDNVRVEPIGSRMPTIYPLTPKKLTFDQTGKIQAKVVPEGKLDRQDLSIGVCINGQTKILPLSEDWTVEADFGKLPLGKVDVKLFLLNQKEKTIIAKYASEFYSRPARNAITIDQDGFLEENGKRFLPIGIFMGTADYQLEKGILKKVRDAGFNTIEQLGTECFYVKRKPTFAATLKASMDEVHKAGLRYVYAIKCQIPTAGNGRDQLDHVKGRAAVTDYIIDLVKDHPAMLAWYCSDENPITDIPHLIELRRRVSFRDGLHPTLALTEKFGEYPKFAQTADILMADIYPVNNKINQAGPEQNMQSCREGLLKAAATSLPVWWVPQIFSWSSFRNVDPNRRYPTAEEIRSMILQGTIRGVQGYLLYAYHPIFYLSEKKDPGKSKMQWDNVILSVKMLNELTPFILSKEKAPEVKVDRISGNMIEARAFRFNGKIRVVITALGPGSSEAVITVPGEISLSSRYGRTVSIGNNQYRFKGLHISSDILQ